MNYLYEARTLGMGFAAVHSKNPLKAGGTGLNERS